MIPLKEKVMVQYSQKITDPDSVQLQLSLENGTVSITDKNKSTVTFSAQLVPEVLGTLQDIEKIYYRKLYYE